MANNQFRNYFKLILLSSAEWFEKEYMAQNLGNRIIIKILLNEILLWVGRWNKFLSGNDAIPDFFLSVNWYQIRKFLVS